MHAACTSSISDARALANPGRAAERPRIRGLARRVGEPDRVQPLFVAERGRQRGAGRLGDVLEQALEGPDRDAEHRIAVAGALAQLALEAVGVVERGHDQHGIAVERRLEAREDLPGAAGVRGPDDQRDSDIAPSIGRRTARDLTRRFRRTPRLSCCRHVALLHRPADAIRAIADSVGREARRQLLGEAVRAWVDEIPDDELEAHYAKAISELDEHDISMLAAWHASMDVGQPVPNRDFLMGAFASLGEHRREALKLAAGFRGEEAVDRGVTEERALEHGARLALRRRG